MLRWRLILGILFIAALAELSWLDFMAARPGAFLLPLAAALSLFSAGELLAMFRRLGYDPLSWVAYGGVLIIVLSAGMPLFAPNVSESPLGQLGWLAIGITIALLIAFVGELRRFQSLGHATTNLALATFAILYAGGLIGFVVRLRLLSGGQWGTDGRWGMVALVSLIATVKMSDIGQYTVGRLVGRHKLAPAVSPGKTWEGAAGGFVFAVIAAWLVFGWAPTLMISASKAMVSFSIRDAAMTTVFAITVAAAGILGDLAESMLKRDAGVKDSSTWMPGFGGILDLLDSLLGAAPVAYLFWALHWVGP